MSKTVCNVALDFVVSDMFGKAAASITDYLIKTDNFDPEYCKSLLQKLRKKKGDIVVESIHGYEISAAKKQRMLMVRSYLEFVEKAIDTLSC